MPGQREARGRLKRSVVGPRSWNRAWTRSRAWSLAWPPAWGERRMPPPEAGWRRFRAAPSGSPPGWWRCRPSGARPAHRAAPPASRSESRPADDAGELADREAVAAEAHQAGGRPAHDGVAVAADLAGIAGIDKAVRCRREVRERGALRSRRKRALGHHGAAQRERAMTRLRRPRPPQSPPSVPRGARTGPSGMGAGLPSGPRRAAIRPISPNSCTSINDSAVVPPVGSAPQLLGRAPGCDHALATVRCRQISGRRQLRGQRSWNHHGVAVQVPALLRKGRAIERMMQGQRSADQEPGQQGHRHAAKRARRDGGQDDRMLRDPALEQRPRARRRSAARRCVRPGPVPCAVTSQVTAAKWAPRPEPAARSPAMAAKPLLAARRSPAPRRDRRARPLRREDGRRNRRPGAP